MKQNENNSKFSSNVWLNVKLVFIMMFMLQDHEHAQLTLHDWLKITIKQEYAILIIDINKLLIEERVIQ